MEPHERYSSSQVLLKFVNAQRSNSPNQFCYLLFNQYTVSVEHLLNFLAPIILKYSVMFVDCLTVLDDYR